MPRDVSRPFRSPSPFLPNSLQALKERQFFAIRHIHSLAYPTILSYRRLPFTSIWLCVLNQKDVTVLNGCVSSDTYSGDSTGNIALLNQHREVLYINGNFHAFD